MLLSEPLEHTGMDVFKVLVVFPMNHVVVQINLIGVVVERLKIDGSENPLSPKGPKRISS